MKKMATTRNILLCTNKLILLLPLFLLTASAFVVQAGGSRATDRSSLSSSSSSSPTSYRSPSPVHFKIPATWGWRRMMIGSTAPTCTYNECRGCKFRCRAEQVPVEGNDPMNSAYRYKCVCHR